MAHLQVQGKKEAEDIILKSIFGKQQKSEIVARVWNKEEQLFLNSTSLEDTTANMDLDSESYLGHLLKKSSKIFFNK